MKNILRKIFRKILKPKKNEFENKDALQKSGQFEHTINYALDFDLSCDDFEKNHFILNKRNNDKIQVINWFVPNAEHILYAGIYTILRFANYFQKNGIKNRLVFYGGNPNLDELKSKIVAEFDCLMDAEFLFFNNDIKELPECDASISTFWSSCYISAKFNKTKKKFYFIQDYEPLFYAAGTVNSVLAEATYRMGFRGIVNTPGLADFVASNHKVECFSFYPCIEKKIYNINKQMLEEKIAKEKVSIVFYGRPNKNRNAFEIGVASLLKIKDKYGEKVEIFSVGDDWKEDDYGVVGKIKNLGRLRSLKEVAEVYRNCDIGLSMMFTKHPSYQPFEFIACGCAVVANYNDANKWFLKDGSNCVISEPIPTCLMEKISILIENKDFRKEIVKKGLEDIEKHEWDIECQKVFEYINK